MRHIPKKELLSIPSLIGCFRLITIPAFVWPHLRTSTDADYYRATTVMGIPSITDMFDGIIARKFNVIMEFGRLLNPFANRLTHGAVLLCLWGRHPLILLLPVLFVLKEGFILVIGTAKLKGGKKLSGAKWFGKYCAALLFVVLFLLLFFPHISLVTVDLLVLLCTAATLVTLFLYIPVFRGI